MPKPSIFEARKAQMFPLLTEAELERVRSFGELTHYEDGDTVVQTGEPGRGITVILSGSVAVMRRGIRVSAPRSSRTPPGASWASSPSWAGDPPSSTGSPWARWTRY